MLTRLRVSGFRNLVDADVRFGPFTCVVGPNGAGKSNLFDAIRFLSALADGTLGEAAHVVCGGRGGADVRDLFHRAGGRVADRMRFVADMVVPWLAVDDLGQEIRPSSTLLRYTLELGRRGSPDQLARGPFAILKEELIHLRQRDAPRHLRFSHSAGDWRRAVVGGRRSAPAFISTEGDGQQRVVVLHRDGVSGVGPVRRKAVGLPRTVLSSAYGAHSPTALAARRELQSWRLLQPEPAALRRPDRFGSPSRMAADGSHLAAALHRLAGSGGAAAAPNPGRAPLEAISDRLGELVGGAHAVQVEVDPERERLALSLLDGDGTVHPASTLADGVLRLLAFLVLAHDPRTRGVLCMEDPERGIHPARIPAVLDLLIAIGVDPHQPVGEHNPLRQVIVSTHAPAVLQQVPDDSVVFVRSGGGGAQFLCLPDTWRARDSRHASRDDLDAYLNPVPSREDGAGGARYTRVVDREDTGQLPLFPD